MQNSGSPFATFPPAAQELIAAAKSQLPPKDAATAETAENQVRQALQLSEIEPLSVGAADLGSAYLLFGQILELQGKPEKIEEAERVYDRARDLFRSIPNPDGALRRLTALAWMNRGNVLQKLKKSEDLAAYDAAAALLADVGSADTDGLSVLAAIYMNRGSSLQRQNTPEARKEAAITFERAVQCLEKLGPAPTPQILPLLAAAHVNYAGALLGVPGTDFGTIRGAAFAGLQLVQRVEGNEFGAAELGLRARRLLCELIGTVLSNPNLAPAARNSLVSEATDLAESGLALSAHWEKKNVTAFRPLVGWFFSFGAVIYARQQPQFLSEFLSDTLAASGTPVGWKSSPELARIAFEAVSVARSFVQERLAAPETGTQADSLTDLLTELNGAAQKYEELAKSA